jgi:tRNA G18 (ribose-2'-O)-methylase SpoU
MGCPGIEPGTSRMKVGSIFHTRVKTTSSQTVLAIFIAHGFPCVGHDNLYQIT